MREIKFRAWGNKTRTMYSWQIMQDSFKNCGLTDTGNNLTVMQYTGLKDKNGVGIYEGDIVKSKFTDDSKFIVEWSDFGCWWGLVNIPDVESGNNLNGSGEDFEVIGNIYENKELLAESEQE